MPCANDASVRRQSLGRRSRRTDQKGQAVVLRWGNFEHTRTGSPPSFSNPLMTPTANGISQLQAAFPNNPAVSTLAAIGPASIKTGGFSFGTPTTVDVLGHPIEFATARRTISSPFNDYEAMGRGDYQLSAHDRIFGRYIYQKNFSYDVDFWTRCCSNGWIRKRRRDQSLRRSRLDPYVQRPDYQPGPL